MKERNEGFTLIEVIISVVVLSLMILAILGIFDVGQDVVSVGCANLMAQTFNTGSMAEMTRNIRQARIFSVSALGDSITLQVPVDWDSDGDVLDVDGNMEWGANSTLNYYLRYVYVEAKTFVEQDEGRNGIDLNQNGATNDTLALGHIAEEIISDDGVTVLSSRQMTPDSIVMVPGAPGQDVNSDGVADPLFVRLNDQGQVDPSGSNIHISFFSFRVANKERTVFLHPTSTVATETY